MDEKITLADLLSKYMQASGLGDARLAHQVNRIMGRPELLHRSTVRNWRTGTSKTIHNWRQVVAISSVLKLNLSETNRLLKVARLPSLYQLWMQAEEIEKEEFFVHWPELVPSKPATGSSTVNFHQYETDLIAGRNVDAAAKRLGDIAIAYNIQEALLILWEAIQETHNLPAIIDACAYTIGRIIWETADLTLEEVGFDLLDKSVRTNSELIIDKFAYTVGQIILETGKDKTRQRACQFVNQHALSANPLVREKYTFTKNRIAGNTRIDPSIVQPTG